VEATFATPKEDVSAAEYEGIDEENAEEMITLMRHSLRH